MTLDDFDRQLAEIDLAIANAEALHAHMARKMTELYVLGEHMVVDNPDHHEAITIWRRGAADIAAEMERMALKHASWRSGMDALRSRIVAQRHRPANDD